MTDGFDPLVRDALQTLERPLPDFDDGWADVLRRAQTEPPQALPRVDGRRSRRTRRHAAVAAVVLAAVGALVIAAPWRTSPSLIERAAAAVSPTSDTILHLRALQRADGARIETESWQLGDPPQALRIARTVDGKTGDVSIVATSSGRGAPFGDAETNWVRGRTLGYCPADGTLRTTDDAVWSFSRFAPAGVIPGAGDPSALIRAALQEGALREAGTAEIQGRTVLRFTGTLPAPSVGTADPVTYDVDRESLLPVHLEWGSGPNRAAVDFALAERLPATQANRVLLDVAAQHPGAPTRDARSAGGPCS